MIGRGKKNITFIFNSFIPLLNFIKLKPREAALSAGDWSSPVDFSGFSASKGEFPTFAELRWAGRVASQ